MNLPPNRRPLFPPQLWYAVLFYTAGEIAMRELKARGIDYSPYANAGFYDNMCRPAPAASPRSPSTGGRISMASGRSGTRSPGSSRHSSRGGSSDLPSRQILHVDLKRNFVQAALGNRLWDLGNEVLYALCREHPSHKSAEVVTAKIWLIGRAYAASIERRAVVGKARGDGFYRDVVAPQILKSKIDAWIEQTAATPDDVQCALETHKEVTALFKNISGLNKTSLASKYLHFHVPEAFFIDDSRARRAIGKLTDRTGNDNRFPDKELCDPGYASFYRRCLDLRTRIEGLRPGRLSPRDLDKVLLAVSETMT